MTHSQQSYPLLSIIVPVYNAETVLPQTIGNIILQTVFDRFGEEAAEIILVDDASTDQTPALLQDVHRQYPNRTKILTLPENRGAGGARGARPSGHARVGAAPPGRCASIPFTVFWAPLCAAR